MSYLLAYYSHSAEWEAALHVNVVTFETFHKPPVT